MISAQSLRFSYDHHTDVLNDLSLNIPEGSLFGLLGPNGAGKSTLLGLLNGMLPLQSGQLTVGQADSKISLVPQDFAFYPKLTVKENLLFFARIQGINGNNCQQAIEKSLHITRLQEHTNQRAERFSGGLKRRLNLAIGLLNSPDILFLDEPTVGIDAQSRHFLLNSIQELNNKGTTVVYTSHYMEEIEAICNHIAIIDDGKIKLQGAIESLLNQTQDDDSIKIELHQAIDAPLKESLSQVMKQGLAFSQHTISISSSESGSLSDVFQCIEASRQTIKHISYGQKKKLETLYLELTDTAIRPQCF